MAVTSIWHVGTRLDHVINYVENPEKTNKKTEQEPEALSALKNVIDYAETDYKTEKGMYVTGIQCNPETAYDDFMKTKKAYDKTDGRLAYHAYQSFLEGEGEISAELAHEIGVKLAQELWGDRFEVVVATHLNTGHYHNHFVINSVSIADGYKFTRTVADYQKMREVSDRLCREAKLNVITNPKYRKKHYKEWQATNEKKATIRSTIRDDIDAAIKVSYTQRQFAKTMKAMGYEFHLETKDGLPLKYPGIKPPGSQKYFRFRSLGPGYDLEEILKKILANNLVSSVPKLRENPHDYKDRECEFRRKYFIFTATISRHVKRKSSFEYIPMAIREDVYKLDEYRIRTDFLYKNNLRTVEQVEAKKQARQKQMAELIDKRTHIYYQLRSVDHANDPRDKELKQEARELTKEISRLRIEIKVCDEILDTSEKVEDFFDSKYKNKEVSKPNVSRDRNSRDGCKNGITGQRSGLKT